jgi:hypothetical protein
MKLYVCWGTFPVPWPRREASAGCASVQARARRADGSWLPAGGGEELRPCEPAGLHTRSQGGQAPHGRELRSRARARRRRGDRRIRPHRRLGVSALRRRGRLPSHQSRKGASRTLRSLMAKRCMYQARPRGTCLASARRSPANSRLKPNRGYSWTTLRRTASGISLLRRPNTSTDAPADRR